MIKIRLHYIFGPIFVRKYELGHFSMSQFSFYFENLNAIWFGPFH